MSSAAHKSNKSNSSYWSYAKRHEPDLLIP